MPPAHGSSSSSLTILSSASPSTRRSAGTDGATWTDIAGATGSTFALTAAQQGGFVRFASQGVNTTGTGSWSYSAPTTAVGAAGSIPAGTVLVSHSFATATAGVDLKTLAPAVGGAWSPHPAQPASVLDVNTDGFAYNPATGISMYANAATLTPDKLVITGTMQHKSTLAGSTRVGFGIKDAAADTGLFFGFCSGSGYGTVNAWQIQRHAAGATAATAAGSAASLGATTYTVRVTLDWAAGTATLDTSSDGGSTWTPQASMTTGLVKPANPVVTLRDDSSSATQVATTGNGPKSIKVVAG